MKPQPYSKYIKVCKDAVKNDEVFATFRSHPEYERVVEACGRRHGIAYLTVIRTLFPHLLQYFPLFQTSETVGAPKKYYYKSSRSHRFSPTTLRYIKVLGDLEQLFGKLDGMDIVEIGGGYGGQCKIIFDYAKPRSYTIVDLPGALKLAEKYLTHFGIDNVQYKKPNDSFDNSYSLCISNYAFSEVSYGYQKIYAKKILKHSAMGYMTCNHFHRSKTRLMYDLDIFKVKRGKFSPETPLTGEGNKLYTWKHIAK